MKPLVVFVLGGPGAGKGTQCARIVEKYGYTHLSAGELLRDERKNPDSQYGELIEKYIKEGKIVPVEITISLLKREMDQTMAANAQKNKFLIDGFPRNQDNLQGWNKTMDGKADVSFVLFFDCNNEICIERCLERGKSSGRSDDNRESLEKRIQTYLESTKPWMEKQMYLLFCFLTVIMRSVLNDVLKGEKVVVGVTTTERAWKREFRLTLNQRNQLLTYMKKWGKSRR